MSKESRVTIAIKPKEVAQIAVVTVEIVVVVTVDIIELASHT